MSVFHAGEESVQARAGVASTARRVGNSIRSFIPDAAREFLLQQPFAVIAATDHHGRVWASLLQGHPGFLNPVDEHTLQIAATLSPVDPLAEMLSPEPTQLGLLAIEPETRRRMRLNGSTRILPDGTLEIHTAEVYANCPKYIQQREFRTNAPEKSVAPVVHRGEGALSATQRIWITRADTFFIGTAHPEKGADASHRGGNPGFVRVSEDNRTIYWPDYPGNAMFNTLGNIAVNPSVGLLFVDFERGDILQLTGTGTILWDADAEAVIPDEERVVAFQIAETIERPGAFTARYRFLEFSKFNPIP